jgi:hypothetical protein
MVVMSLRRLALEVLLELREILLRSRVVAAFRSAAIWLKS